MNGTENTGLQHLAVQIVTTYERMKRNAAYRVLSLIFGCITLVIVKLVQMASKEKNTARIRRDQLYKELVNQGELAALQEEAAQQIRRKNQFFNKNVSESEVQRQAEKIGLQEFEEKVNRLLENEGIDASRNSEFHDTFVALLSKMPFFVFSVIVSFPMYILVAIYMQPYIKFTVDRMAMLVFVLFGVIFLVFSILYISPSDPAVNILGDKATPEKVEQFREIYGLNKPYLGQFLDTVKRIATFDLGRSFVGNENINEAIARKFPVTMQLALCSISWAILAGIAVGVVSAIRQYSAFDNISMLVVLLALSIPHFWLGLVLVLNFSIKLGSIRRANGRVCLCRPLYWEPATRPVSPE